MTVTDESRSIVDACTRLSLDVARYTDARDIDAVTARYTEDAVFERKGETLRGRAAIRAAQEARPIEALTRHVCANTYVDVIDDDHAKGLIYFVLYRYDAPAGTEPLVPAKVAPPQTVGEFHDEYVRTPDGWRISRRTAIGIFRA